MASDVTGDPTLVDQASQLLKEINLLYGLASGALLKYAFENTSDSSTFKKGKTLLALGAALGSLMLALVLIALMLPVAVDAMGPGEVSGTLVIYELTFAVIFGLAALSMWAVGRSVRLLLKFKRAWLPKSWTKRMQGTKRGSPR